MKIAKKALLIGVLAVATGITGWSVVMWREGHDIPAIIDPDDPGFDPKRFHFKNYPNTSPYFIKALIRMFPPGTPKESFDEIIVKRSGGFVRKKKAKYHALGWTSNTYDWPRGTITSLFFPLNAGGRDIHVVFDKNSKSIIMRNGYKLLYGIDPKTQVGKEKSHE